MLTKEGYTFLYWQNGEVAFDFGTIITEEITLVAKWKINEYTVTFKNWDGSILEQKNVEYGELPTYTLSVPTRPSDEMYKYTFKGWDKEINTVKDNIEYIAEYDTEKIDYIVTFKFNNGEPDFVKSYHYGDVVIFPDNPTKPSDKVYEYTFSNWKSVDTGSEQNIIYEANYTKEFVDYTVTFKFENGEEDLVKTYHYGDIVEVPGKPVKAADETYTYTFSDWDKPVSPVSGNTVYTAKYDKEYIDYTITFKFENGTEDLIKTYHFGDIVEIPEDPEKAADDIYEYTFAGWDKLVNKVEGDAVYIATYNKDYVDYTVTFDFGNGEPDFVKTYHFGDVVQVPANPSKDSNETFTYTFAGWDKEITTVNGDVEYKATYTREYVEYTVTFVLGNSEEDIVKTYHYYDTVEVPEDPEKAATAEYSYKFANWDSEIETKVKSDATYTAVYTETKNKYTVTFKNYDGTVLESKKVEYGETPTYTGATPVKVSDETYTYEFKDWDRELSVVEGDTEYVAEYTQTYIDYTVTFEFGNGDVPFVKTYHYGDTVEIPGDPTKIEDKVYTYEFAHWDKEITVVDGSKTYTAVYTPTYIDYTVRFVLGNGEADIVQTYHYGDAVEVPTNLSKAADDTYTYSFAGWDKEPVAVDGDATYTAKYDATYIEYEVRFVLGNGEADLVKTYHFGDIVEVPDKPEKAADETYTYAFKDWDKQVVAVAGNETYTAVYTPTYIDYTIRFVLGNGEADVVRTYHYGDIVEVPAKPVKAADETYTYAFKDWDKQVVAVDGNATYTAVYTPTYIDYTIRFVLGNGEQDVVRTYHYGDKLEVPAKPEKAADETYTYAFKDWDKQVVTVAGNETYTATYDATYIDYTIRFVLGNGEADLVKTYHFGDIVEVPDNPEKAADKTYTYAFKDWDKQVVAVAGNETYTAVYTPTYIDYTIRFVLGNGEADVVRTYHYGDTVVEPQNPEKAETVEYSYIFIGWDKAVSSVLGDATYTAVYITTKNKYTVTFKNYDGTVLQQSQVEYGETPTYTGATPVKVADDTYTYTFAGWDKQIDAVQGKIEYTAVYTSTYIDYTVTFDFGNGEPDFVKTYHYGDVVQVPANPSKDSNETFTYTFAGWDKEITTVNGDVEYKAKYTRAYVEYTVRFVLENGEEDIVKTYHYYDTVEIPEDPEKAATTEYSYTFAKWDSEIETKVKGDATYTAVYTETKNKYTVTFKNYDGTVLESKKVEYGETPTYTGTTPVRVADETYTYEFKDWDRALSLVEGNTEYVAEYTPTYIDYTITFEFGNGEQPFVKTYHYGDIVEVPENPSKLADKVYTYKFAEWDSEITTVDGNKTYTAVYTPTYIDYTIRFVLGNGEADIVKTYHYGDTVEVPAKPEKAADETYTYAFAGWDKAVEQVAGDTVYTATYDATYIDYTIRFVLGNGEADVVKTYHYGDVVEVPAKPVKAADETYTYAFKDWDKQVVTVAGNETYTATYDSTYIDYTIRFVLGNGEADIVQTYHYGDIVEVPAKPVKAADETYTYTFKDWDKQVVAVDGNATYTAVYTPTYIEYEVRFVLGNGEQDVVRTYHYGDTVVEVPGDPSKAADETYTYAFKDWDKQVVAVDGNATYTAVYTSTYIDYTVTFDFGNGEPDFVKTYHYGDVVQIPDNPSKDSNETFTYTFAGWDKEITTVNGNVEYKAKYTREYVNYTITFVLGNGQPDIVKTYHYYDTVEVPEDPEKVATAEYSYKFANWDSEVETKVKSDATYTAVYTETKNKYTVTFKNHDGTVLESKKVEYGETPTYTGTTPVKVADETYTYEFKSWDRQLSKVEGNAEYVAEYNSTYINYTVTFEFGNGAIPFVKTYHYGDVVEVPVDPSKAADETYTYTFSGWDKAIDTVKGNTTYTAVYTPTYIDYTIRFVLGNGEADIVQTYHYGDVVEVPGDPSKAADETYTYTFAGWDKAVDTVKGNTTYTATYDATYIDYTVRFVLGNGEADIVQTYHYGDDVTVPENPSKAGNKIHKYTFTNWDKEITVVSGDVTYTALYKQELVEYTVTFKLGNGEENIVQTYHYGDTVVAPANPSKAEDETYTYAFASWDKDIVEVTENTVYTAVYTPTYIEYTVRFVLGNGEADVVRTYHYGDTVVVPNKPEKAATAEYTYTFADWDKAVTTVDGHATYTAIYTAVKNKYTVTFKNYDGAVLEEKQVEYGETPTYTGATPVKVGNEIYKYDFTTWDRELVKVTGKTEYTAQFKQDYVDYTVTFKLDNGEADVVQTYHYGDTVVAPQNPSKAADKIYTYTFANWDREFVTVTENTTYTAIYTPTYIDYTVTFKFENGQADNVATYHYGDTVVVPSKPEKAATAEYTYTFANWDKTVTAVEGNTVYTAVYTATKNKYTVRIYDSSGNLKKTEVAEYGTQLRDLVALTEDGIWVEAYEGHELTDIITGHTDLVIVETAEIRKIDDILDAQLAQVDNSNMTASFNEEESLISVDFKNEGKEVSAMLDDTVAVLKTITNSDDSYESIVLSYPGATDLDLKQLDFSKLKYWNFILRGDDATKLARFIARVGKNSGSGSHALGVTTTELATRTAATHITVTVTLKDGYVNEEGLSTFTYDLIFTEPSTT